MFEKEAEEYINKNKIELSKILDSIGIDFVLSSQGQKLKTVFKRIWQYGAEFGYNKANEWHYVKDELPPSDKDKYYFVVDKLNEPMIARFYEGKWSNYSVIEDAIAWKEIVLPELKESE